MKDTMNIKDHDLRKLLDILYTKELERKVTLKEKEELNRKISDLNNTVESLQKRIVDLESERQEFERSNSWRITRPLRKIADYLRRK